MAKVKNKRNAGLADRVHKKKKNEAFKKKVNPFEVHVNKEKIKVLGQKSKHDRGLPGVSRAKAIKKRKETLGTELKLMNKTNTFIDKRIGEKDSQLSSEERIVARFAAERAKQHSRKNIYNLADDEVLTHRGQTLEQIEKFDDPRSSDEEDDDGRKLPGGLDDEFVSSGHFGGGALTRGAADGAGSHRDLIERLIAESKKRKHEKQKEKESTLDLTEKLDSEWKDLQPMVLKKPRAESPPPAPAATSAEERARDYDKAMRELRFEKRGTPSDGLKSDEQQAKEERQRYEQLQRERERRMLGEEDAAPAAQPAGKHRSAEELDDNFELEEAPDYMLSYDADGNPLLPEHVLRDRHVPKAQNGFNDGISDTSSEEGDDEKEEEDDDDDEEDNSEEEDNKSEEEDSDAEEPTTKNNKTKFVEAKTNGNKESSDDDQSDDSDNENVEKVKSTSANVTKSKKDSVISTRVTVDVKDKEKDTEITADESKDSEENSDSEEDSDDEDEEDDKIKNLDKDLEDLKDLRDSEPEIEESEADDEEITNFFDGVGGDNLKELLADKTPTQQASAVQKLIKQYDPRTDASHKDLLSKVFAQLLQYVHDIFANLTQEGEVIKAFLIFEKLAPFFYDLAHTNKVSSKQYLADVLKKKHDEFLKNRRRVPDMSTLIFFKLASLVYPTSDFRHPITTPSLIFMSEILTHCRFRDVHSISRGLFVTALILEYTVLSKRFMPSAINFLRGLLYLTANTSVLNPVQVVPPFKLHRDAKLLSLDDDSSHLTVSEKLAAKDLVSNVCDGDFKIRCLAAIVAMLKEFFDNADEIEAQECIFAPHIQLMGRIDLEWYPKNVAVKVQEVVDHMKQSLEVKTLVPLHRERKKPKALRLYEPEFQEVFTGSRSSKLPREQAERAKLQHKVKRELKGAVREVRRDRAYLAAVKLRQRIQSDNVRKEKVKQIYKDASIQQGELNKLKRTK